MGKTNNLAPTRERHRGERWRLIPSRDDFTGRRKYVTITLMVVGALIGWFGAEVKDEALGTQGDPRVGVSDRARIGLDVGTS